jgi:hypothetical protein
VQEGIRKLAVEVPHAVSVEMVADNELAENAHLTVFFDWVTGRRLHQNVLLLGSNVLLEVLYVVQRSGKEVL